ncbi:porin [Pseudomonas oryzihabitans]|nr:porin [Pseudomonas psychrotolerans]KTT39847.1 porin [Pseudomonas psychrotolerans]KTT45821.1 porin [Pseudomonas psychrotolerans]KTT66635.1 porin [Pseudomonas psychrotolerans]
MVVRLAQRFLLLSLAVLTGQAEAAGFLEDSHAVLTFRNFFFQRDFTQQSYPLDRAREWTQGFILDARSGFTPGPVGFGVDVLGKYAVKLDGGAGRYGALLLPRHSDGEPAADFGRLGLAAKARFAKTEFKYGEWMPNLPLLNADDFRALPQTFQGMQLTSTEIKNLKLQLGQFRRTSLRNDDSLEKLGYGKIAADSFDFVGADYEIAATRTTLRLWSGELEDVYRQHYLGVIQSLPLGGDRRLDANLGVYRGREAGRALAGDLDNTTYSLLVSLRSGAQVFSLGRQLNQGATGWMRVNGTGGIYLANNTFNTAFDNPHENSWQLRYDYDFTGLGLPGLSLMTRYVRGDDVRLAKVRDGREWVRESELAYVFKSGALKDLSLRWRNATVRRDFSNLDYDENRVIVSYPLSLL